LTKLQHLLVILN